MKTEIFYDITYNSSGDSLYLRKLVCSFILFSPATLFRLVHGYWFQQSMGCRLSPVGFDLDAFDYYSSSERSLGSPLDGCFDHLEEGRIGHKTSHILHFIKTAFIDMVYA